MQSYFRGVITGSPSTISINTSGRYLRVQLQGANTLSIAEFEVRQTCIFANDDCDDNVAIDFSETTSPGVCNYLITRTWTATDNCGNEGIETQMITVQDTTCLLYTSPSPRDATLSRMPSSA